MVDAIQMLREQWENSAVRLERRLKGLGDAEYFWAPVPNCWTIRPADTAPGDWTYDYDYDPPAPHPVTTIGWRLVHIAADNWIYAEHAFGPGQRNFPDLPVPATAADAVANWLDSRTPVSTWLQQASNTDLDEPRPSHLGAPKSAAEVMMILIDEQVHHGAEIALLRDLYLRTAAE